jgi:hypothetical protein
MGWMAESFLGNTVASVRKRREGGKHRTEVTEVTEGKMGWMAESLLGNTVASVRERREGGKHRAEVTEVTEGEMGGWPKAFGEYGGCGARTT